MAHHDRDYQRETQQCSSRSVATHETHTAAGGTRRVKVEGTPRYHFMQCSDETKEEGVGIVPMWPNRPESFCPQAQIKAATMKEHSQSHR
ncbi:hypothetical protein Dda_2332 [Drechslerella dactyloides]|uniref:Uncharacterized protein n=1 Tax=Drechslerella dactyloides TaxID=74499 RepID=A0AAD6J7C1_DREDA|nr:hypothetical protein Dda_2332 [Drechslerella dactyloides]